jgi:hypothetical protein
MGGSWLVVAYNLAALNAILAGDETGLRAAYGPWRPLAPRGRYADTFIDFFEGAIDIWEGRVAQGAARIRNAAETLDEMGMRLDRAFTLLGAVRLLGVDDAYGRTAADAVRGIAGDLGSPTLEALLEAMIEAGRRPTPAATTDRQHPRGR